MAIKLQVPQGKTNRAQWCTVSHTGPFAQAHSRRPVSGIDRKGLKPAIRRAPTSHCGGRGHFLQSLPLNRGDHVDAGRVAAAFELGA